MVAPPGLGPLGPLAAGVLAVLGHRAVRRGRASGPLLARAAMTAALLLMVHQAWAAWVGAPVAAARAAIAARISEVDAALRTGTAESAWDLLEPGTDHDRFVADLRAAMAELGALSDLGEPRAAGGDWESATASFRDGDRAEARFGLAFDAEFTLGPGVVSLDLVVLREGRRVSASLAGLSVTPR